MEIPPPQTLVILVIQSTQIINALSVCSDEKKGFSAVDKAAVKYIIS